MASRPTHRAYVVADPRNDDDKSHWTEIGVVFPHSKGGGFDVIIANQLSVAGRIVCRPITEQADRPADQPARAPRREPVGTR